MTRLTRPLITSLISVSALVLGAWPMAALASTAPGLGTAASYAILAGTTVTNTGNSVITGSVGISPGAACTGLPAPCIGGGPGTVVGGTIHAGDAAALQAQTDLTAAYGVAASSPCNSTSLAAWGGQTLTPGTYCQTTSPTISGTLTLSGNGVFIFKTGSTLVTAPGATVAFINGARPCNVFWQVSSSATLDTTTTFVGTIMALTSITVNNGATIQGRLLARNGQVSLINDRIIAPTTCNTPGASEQIADLIQLVTQNQLGPGTSLVDKLQAVQTAIAANDTSGACGTLQAFIHEVQAQSGKHLTSDQAAQLITAANRIRAVLGC
jgi:Ice-binding-like